MAHEHDGASRAGEGEGRGEMYKVRLWVRFRASCAPFSRYTSDENAALTLLHPPPRRRPPSLTFLLPLEQIVDGKQDLEKFSNAFINLALPFFGFSDPIAAAKQQVRSSFRGRAVEEEEPASLTLPLSARSLSQSLPPALHSRHCTATSATPLRRPHPPRPAASSAQSQEERTDVRRAPRAELGAARSTTSRASTG